MKRMLIAGLAVLAGSAKADVDPKISEFCLKAQDFKGCVEAMSKPAPENNAAEDSRNTQRSWTRDSGVVVRMKISSITAMKSSNGEYGRHIRWVYGRDGFAQGTSTYWGLGIATSSASSGTVNEVQADCVNYTADWHGDNFGWRSVKDPEKYRRDKNWYEPVLEAKQVMDEFCPQMNQLLEKVKGS